MMITSLHSPYKRVLKHYHRDLTWKNSNDPSRSLGGEINPLKSTPAGEQLMQATSANTTTQANNLNLDTLATAVSLLEKLPLE